MLCPQIYNLDEMEKVLERCNLLKLTQEEIGNPNKLISAKETESIINHFSQQNVPGPDEFTHGFYQTFKEGIIPIFYNLYYEASITLIPKPDKDITRKENYRPLSFTKHIDAKILNKIPI